MDFLTYKNKTLLSIIATLGCFNIASVNYIRLNLNYLNSLENNSQNTLFSGKIESSMESSISEIASKVDLVEISYKLVGAISQNFSKQGSRDKHTLEKRITLDNNSSPVVSQIEFKTLNDKLKPISYQIISTQNSDTEVKVEKNNDDLTSEKFYYTVVFGDSLSKIAQKYGVSYVDIAKASNISPRSYDNIEIGQVLVIPRSSTLNVPVKQALSNVGVKTKVGPKVSKLEQQLFVIAQKSKSSNLPQGFIAKDYEHNWNLLKQKSGEEIWDLRKKLGVVALGNLIGVKPGKCIPQKEERVEAIKEKYSLIKEKAKLHSNVLPEVLAGLIAIESGGNSKCISESGALGVKQLTKSIYNPTRSWNDGEKRETINPFNDEKAIERGADLLSTLLKKYNGNYHFALSAYNQGENEVDVAIAKAKEDGITNSYEIVSNYLNEEGREFSRKVLNATKGVKREMKSSLELAMITN